MLITPALSYTNYSTGQRTFLLYLQFFFRARGSTASAFAGGGGGSVAGTISVRILLVSSVAVLKVSTGLWVSVGPFSESTTRYLASLRACLGCCPTMERASTRKGRTPDGVFCAPPQEKGRQPFVPIQLSILFCSKLQLACVLHIRQFVLSVDTQHIHSVPPCRFFLPEMYKLYGHKTTAQHRSYGTYEVKCSS